MKFAMVMPDGSVASVVEAADPKLIAMNTPAGAKAIECPGSCRPGKTVVVDGKFVDAGMTVEEQWDEIRVRRNALLASSDQYVLPDAPVSAVTKALWVTYREALRNLTNVADPSLVVWPTPPKG